MTANDPANPDDFRRSVPGYDEPIRAELVPAGNADDVIRAPDDVAELGGSPPLYRRPRRRRVVLPVVLFVASCLSTFWVGATFLVEEPIARGAHAAADTAWNEAIRSNPAIAADNAAKARIESQASVTHLLAHNYPSGLTYMAAVIGILLCHEMGHFLQTLRHRIPASLPFFIPMPLGPIGTMGAVIGMDGSRANRRELFDIGVSGPIAGLIVAIPITWIGVQQAAIADPLPPNATGVTIMHDPWIVQELISYLRPDVPAGRELQLNPLLLAGWVGMLITGLNMMPISQLDGGHVIYALFGRRRAHLIAKAFLVVAILYVVFANASMWTMMLILVILIGPTHPPTADDSAELSLPQKIVGYASLAIPFLCFPPQGITIH